MVPEKGVQNRGGFSGPFDLVGRVGALHYARNTSQMGGAKPSAGYPAKPAPPVPGIQRPKEGRASGREPPALRVPARRGARSRRPLREIQHPRGCGSLPPGTALGPFWSLEFQHPRARKQPSQTRIGLPGPNHPSAVFAPQNRARSSGVLATKCGPRQTAFSDPFLASDREPKTWVAYPQIRSAKLRNQHNPATENRCRRRLPSAGRRMSAHDFGTRNACQNHPPEVVRPRGFTGGPQQSREGQYLSQEPRNPLETGPGREAQYSGTHTTGGAQTQAVFRGGTGTS